MAVLGDGLGQPAVVHPVAHVLADHAGDHHRPAQAHGPDVRGTEREALEDVVFGAEAAGEGEIGHALALGHELVGELHGGRVEVDAGHAPLFHHPPGAHAGPAGGAVDGQQVDLGLAPPLQGHGQLAESVGPRFERDPLEAELAEPIALGQEARFVDEAEAAVALELLDGAVVVAGLDDGVGRIGGDDVSASLELQGPLDRVDLDLPADALGALAPLELDGVEAVLAADVLGDAEPGILDVHLDEDLAQAAMIPLVGLDAAVHVGGRGDLALGIELQLGVDPADVLAADGGDARDCRSDGEVLPVLSGDLGGAQRAGEDGGRHPDLAVPTVLGLDAHCGEGAGIGVGLRAFGQPAPAQGVTLDIEVRVVDGVVLVAAGGDVAERAGVDQLAAPERGLEHLAVADTAVHAARAEARLGHHASRAVLGDRGVIGVGFLKIHLSPPSTRS